MGAGRTLDRIILAVLVVGAVIFVLLLAGVGSDLLTNPAGYTP